MKGIILAGGTGSRLHPCTKVTSKQLLPIYNKPMIYYPLETLLKAGIQEILIIVAPEHAGDFVNLLGSGKDFGARFFYEVQDKPEGLAQAFLIGESFIEQEAVTMILGDNIFEDDFSEAIHSFQSGARVFAKQVQDPDRFGVVHFDEQMKAIDIEEKPMHPKSDYAVTGLYVFDCSVVEKAKQLKPSIRGEYEITDLIRLYLQAGELDVRMVDGAWLDTGTFESMYQATEFVRSKALKAQQAGQPEPNSVAPRSVSLQQ